MRPGIQGYVLLLRYAVPLLVLLLLPELTWAQAADCTGYDSQIWAQSVYENDPGAYADLDPDGNGLACENLSPGAAPALWTTQIPAAAESAALVSVADGNTIRVFLDGQEQLVRLALVDTPKVNDPTTPAECFGYEASVFLEWLLSLGGELFLEADASHRDQDDLLLGYVWLDFGDGEVYLVNEAMVRSGFAAAHVVLDDAAYSSEIRAAEMFARGYDYGLWKVCGGPHASIPEVEPLTTVEPGLPVNGCGPDRPNLDTICPVPAEPAAAYIAFVRATDTPEGVQIGLTNAGVTLGQTCTGAGQLAMMVSELYQKLPTAERVTDDLTWTDPYLTREIRAHTWGATSGIPEWEARGNPIDVDFADYTSPGHASQQWEDLLALSLFPCNSGA